MRVVAVVLAILSVLSLGRANISRLTVHRASTDLACGTTVQVALYGPDLPPDTPKPYFSRRDCERAAIVRLVGWGLTGWALLGAAILVPRRRRPERTYDTGRMELDQRWRDPVTG